MSPAVALRPPEDLPGLQHVHHLRLTQLRGRVDAGFAGLADQCGRHAVGRVEASQLQSSGVAGVLQEVDRLSGLPRPPRVHQGGRMHDRGRPVLLAHHGAISRRRGRSTTSSPAPPPPASGSGCGAPRGGHRRAESDSTRTNSGRPRWSRRCTRIRVESGDQDTTSGGGRPSTRISARAPVASGSPP